MSQQTMDTAVPVAHSNTRWHYYWDLIAILAQKEIKTRYKNNVLGYLWSLANPMAYTAIFYFAFQVVFKIDIPNYVLFLICGLFPWQWISNSIVGSSMIFFQNASLIKKASFPRYVLPLAIGLQDGFHFLMTLPVIFLFMIIGGVMPTWEFLIGLPLMMILQFFIIYGLGLAIGSINLFFRDMEKLVGIALQMAFYVTPILYPATKVPEHLRYLLFVNPFTPIILCWKTLFLEGRIHWQYLGAATLYCVVALAIGSFVYRRLVWKFSEVL